MRSEADCLRNDRHPQIHSSQDQLDSPKIPGILPCCRDVAFF